MRYLNTLYYVRDIRSQTDITVLGVQFTVLIAALNPNDPGGMKAIERAKVVHPFILSLAT